MAHRALACLLVIAAATACASPPTHVLYVANRGSDEISAYAIDATTGVLSPVSGSPFRAGSVPGSMAAAPSGPFIYVANHFSQDVSAYAVQSSGALTPVPGSPFTTPAFPLSIAVGASGRFVYVTSAGMPRQSPDLAGRVATYTVDPTSGALSMIADAEAGAGAVDMAVSSDGYVYASNLLSHDISAYASDERTGALTPMAGSPFPSHRVRLGGGETVRSPSGEVLAIPPPTIEVPHRAASVAVTPSGAVYVVGHALALPMPVTMAGRGSAMRNGEAATAMSSVSAYVVNRATGTLTPVDGSPWAAGRRPTAIALTPSGHAAYVANLESNDVSAFTVDAATGALAEVAGSPFKAGSRPSAVAVDVTGRFVYVANAGSNDVSGFVIDTTTGALRAIGAAPVKAGAEPIALIVAGASRRGR